MLFNSTEFLLVFFPLALTSCFLLSRISKAWALSGLAVASLLFYAWWRPVNVLIIVPSILVNFGAAKLLLHLIKDEKHRIAARAVLIAGIVANLALLGYFKYANDVQGALNDAWGTDFVLTQIVLPLGLSFITFQKIAFLVDVHGRRIPSLSFREYCVFVLFFPQLIAGPIVHFREIVPQLRSVPFKARSSDISVGLTILAIGLFKKVILADGIVSYVNPVYDAAASGTAVTLFPAWLAAVGFTLQIYFDFSAYSDMAIGIARCFGVKLPLNFDSPLKASSIIDFWLRWHVTLTRFLTAYIYNPLTLYLTRKRLARGLPALGGRRPSLSAFVHVLAIPTLITMLISGLWHGTGVMFVLWGLLHGVYIVVNHAWRVVAARRWPDKARYKQLMRAPGLFLTFIAVVVAMVLFRTPTLSAALSVFGGMAGLHGVEMPRELIEPLGISNVVGSLVTLQDTGARDFVFGYLWLVSLLAIALLLPNSLQFVARYEPVVGAQPTSAGGGFLGRALVWQPTVLWAIAITGLAAIALWVMGRSSVFLYWQF